MWCFWVLCGGALVWLVVWRMRGWAMGYGLVSFVLASGWAMVGTLACGIFWTLYLLDIVSFGIVC